MKMKTEQVSDFYYGVEQNFEITCTSNCNFVTFDDIFLRSFHVILLC